MVGSTIIRKLTEDGYSNIIKRSRSDLDLLKQKDVADFLAEERPDYVILAAGKVGGIQANNTYRGQFLYENLMMQSNIINAAYENNVKKL